ncbi:MAG: hypothetical protein DRN25_01520, partial [Thermoplasmata archaeon]
EDNFSKWYYEWDTSDIPWGIYLIFARGVDSKGIYSDPAIVAVEVNNLNFSILEKSVAMEFYISKSSVLHVSNLSIEANYTPLNGIGVESSLVVHDFFWGREKGPSRLYVTWDNKNKTFYFKREKGAESNVTLIGSMLSIYGYEYKNGKKANMSGYFIVGVNKLILLRSPGRATEVRFSFVKSVINGSLCVELSSEGGSIDITGLYLNWNGWVYSNPDIHFSGSDLEISFTLQLGVGEDILRYWIPNEFTGWISIGSKENNFTFDGAVDLVIPGGFRLQVGGKIHFYSKDGELNISWNLKRDEWARASLSHIFGYRVLRIEDFYVRVSYVNNLSAIIDLHIANLSTDGSKDSTWVFDINDENTSLMHEGIVSSGKEKVFSIDLSLKIHNECSTWNVDLDWTRYVTPSDRSRKTSFKVVFSTRSLKNVTSDIFTEKDFEKAVCDLITGLKVINIKGYNEKDRKTIDSAHFRISIINLDKTVAQDEEKVTNVTTLSDGSTLTNETISRKKVIDTTETFIGGGISIDRLEMKRSKEFILDIKSSSNSTGNITLYVDKDFDRERLFLLEGFSIYGKGWKKINVSTVENYTEISVLEPNDENSTNKTVLRNENTWRNETANAMDTFAEFGMSIGRVKWERSKGLVLAVNFSFNETGNVNLFVHRDPTGNRSFLLEGFNIHGRGWREYNDSEIRRYTEISVLETNDGDSTIRTLLKNEDRLVYKEVNAINQSLGGEFNVDKFGVERIKDSEFTLDFNISWNSTGISKVRAYVDRSREKNLLLLLEGLYLNISGRKEQYTENLNGRKKKLLSHLDVFTELSGEFNLSSEGALLFKYDGSKGELVFEKEGINEVTISEPYFRFYIDWNGYQATTKLSADEIYMLANELHAYINSSTKKFEVRASAGFRMRNGSFEIEVPIGENRTFFLGLHGGDLRVHSNYFRIFGYWTRNGKVYASFVTHELNYVSDKKISLLINRVHYDPENGTVTTNTSLGFELSFHKFSTTSKRGYLNFSYRKDEFYGENVITLSGNNVRIEESDDKSSTFDVIVNGTKVLTLWRRVDSNTNTTKDWRLVARWKGDIWKLKPDYVYIDYYVDKEITGGGNIYGYEKNDFRFRFIDYFDIASEVNFTDDKSVHREVHIYWKPNPNDFKKGYLRFNYTGKVQSTSWRVRVSHRIGGTWFEMKTGKMKTKNREFSFDIDSNYNLNRNNRYAYGQFTLDLKSSQEKLEFLEVILTLGGSNDGYELEIPLLQISRNWSSSSNLHINGSYYLSGNTISLSAEPFSLNIPNLYLYKLKWNGKRKVLHLSGLSLSGDISFKWEKKGDESWESSYILILTENGINLHLDHMRLGSAMSGDRIVIEDLDASIYGDLIIENLTKNSTEWRLSTSGGIDGSLSFKLYKKNEGNYYKYELNGYMSPGSYLVGEKEIPGYDEGKRYRFSGDLDLGKLSIKKEENGEEKEIVDMHLLTVDTNGGYFEYGWGKKVDSDARWIKTEGVTQVTFLNGYVYGYEQNGRKVWNITITNITLSGFTAKKIKYYNHPDSDIEEAREVYLDGELSVIGGIDGTFIIKDETSSEEVLSFKPYASYGLWIDAYQAKIGWAKSVSDPQNKKYKWITTNGDSILRGIIEIDNLSISGEIVVDGSVRILHNKNWVVENFDGSYDCEGGSLTITSNFPGAYSSRLDYGEFKASISYKGELLFDLSGIGSDISMFLPQDTTVVIGIGKYVDSVFRGFYMDITGGKPSIVMIFNVTSLTGERKINITGSSISASHLKIRFKLLGWPQQIGGDASPNMHISVQKNDGSWKQIWPIGGGSEDLTVWADVDPNYGYANDTVFIFSGTVLSGGESPYTYHWEFGDDNSEEITTDEESCSVQHTYSSPGEYTATLTVTDNEGNTAIATVTVNVTDDNDDEDGNEDDETFSVELTADPPSTYVNHVITFTATVSGGNPPYTYTFDFGDGSPPCSSFPTYDTTCSLQHSYSSPGDYTVTVTVHDNDGKVAEDQITVHIEPAD